MALTKGERTTITTASSVANRMGVVPAYGGNPITTIAEVATEKLDFFAKRQATLQEGKYKADLEIQTRAYINEIGREYFDNPNPHVFTTWLNTGESDYNHESFYLYFFLHLTIV